jgi:hypothetical protein
MAGDDKFLDDALADSFPASDPIACSNPTTGTRKVRVTALPVEEQPQVFPNVPARPWRLGALAAFAIGFVLAWRR